jgi:hypothetical protein
MAEITRAVGEKKIRCGKAKRARHESLGRSVGGNSFILLDYDQVARYILRRVCGAVFFSPDALGFSCPEML